MHSWTYDGNIIFHHNGDYSGDVKVMVNSEAISVEESTWPTREGRERKWVEIEIPFEALRALVLNYLMSKKISQIEQANNDEFEQILLGGPFEKLDG